MTLGEQPSTARTIEVAVVGGGIAGAAVAIRLAAMGREVMLFERLAAPRWRASGVYSSPATVALLRDLGLGVEATARLATPIDAMVVRSERGVSCSLEHSPLPAAGLDRVRLERALLDRATAADVVVREGAVVREIRGLTGSGAPELQVSTSMGSERWRPRIVIGADGPRSLVARRAGVQRKQRLLDRAALTVHLSDGHAGTAVAASAGARQAEMVLGSGWYCGIAPVPGDRVNIGIVIAGSDLRRRASAGEAPRSIVRSILEQLPPPLTGWANRPTTDEVRVAYPLAHRTARTWGRDFLLVGDATGFLDPLSGEGIHRALVSAELAAGAVDSKLRRRTGALENYHRQLRRRFGHKDAVSWLLQVFLARPALVDYALSRLDRRPGARRTFGLVLADLLPAGRALEPRFLLSVLAP